VGAKNGGRGYTRRLIYRSSGGKGGVLPRWKRDDFRSLHQNDFREKGGTYTKKENRKGGPSSPIPAGGREAREKIPLETEREESASETKVIFCEGRAVAT